MRRIAKANVLAWAVAGMLTGFGGAYWAGPQVAHALVIELGGHSDHGGGIDLSVEVGERQHDRVAVETVDVNAFYDQLTPYGEWVEIPKYHHCWRPRGVAQDWRPYSVGHWVYTDQGWTWVSEEPFGDITCHYGGWIDDPKLGWCWVPGDVYAPAWVAWRYSDNVCGWAPLPPEDCTGRVIVAADVEALPAASFCFVPSNRVLDGRIDRVVMPAQQNVTLVKQTTNITNINVTNNVVVNKSLDVQKVEKVTKQTVKPVSMTKVSDPKEAAAARQQGKPVMYAPPAKANTKQPQQQVQQPTNPPAQTPAQTGQLPNQQPQPGRAATPPTPPTEAPRAETPRTNEPPRAQTPPVTPPQPQQSAEEARRQQDALKAQQQEQARQEAERSRTPTEPPRAQPGVEPTPRAPEAAKAPPTPPQPAIQPPPRAPEAAKAPPAAEERPAPEAAKVPPAVQEPRAPEAAKAPTPPHPPKAPEAAKAPQNDKDKNQEQAQDR